MLNYIRSELYRALHIKGYLWLSVFILSIIILATCSAPIQFLPEILITFSSVGVICLVQIVAIFTYKKKEIQRQILSYGTSKLTIFVGDIIVQSIIIILYILQVVLLTQLIMLAFGTSLQYIHWIIALFEILCVPALVISVQSIVYIVQSRALGVVIYTCMYTVVIGSIYFLFLLYNSRWIFWLMPYLFANTIVIIIDGNMYYQNFNQIEYMTTTYSILLSKLPIIFANFIVNFLAGYMVFKNREY